jgi:uncharacterized damage-inducible protein DinB
MNVPEYVANQTERIAEALAHFVATTKEDKLDWQPTQEGSAPCRSVYQQISECVVVNRIFAKMLRGEIESAPLGERPEITFASPQDAQEQLLASARELAGAIRGLSEADLAREYKHPRGTMRGENFILMAYRNMAYHAGQINFIQTLYGDTEFHVPSNWR